MSADGVPRLTAWQSMVVVAAGATASLVATWLTGSAPYGQALAGVIVAVAACTYLTWLVLHVRADARHRRSLEPHRRVDPATVRVVGGRRRW